MRGGGAVVLGVVVLAVLAGCGEEGAIEHGSSSRETRPAPFERGSRIRTVFSLRNHGKAELTVLGFADPGGFGIRAGDPRMQGDPHSPGALRPLRPFKLEPGAERGVGLTYTVTGSCREYEAGAFVTIHTVPVRFRTAGDEHTAKVTLRSKPSFEGTRRCPGRKDDG